MLKSYFIKVCSTRTVPSKSLVIIGQSRGLSVQRCHMGISYKECHFVAHTVDGSRLRRVCQWHTLGQLVYSYSWKPKYTISQREILLSFPSGIRFVKQTKTTSIMALKVLFVYESPINRLVIIPQRISSRVFQRQKVCITLRFTHL